MPSPAPISLALPPGFADDTPNMLALGGQLKSSICLLADQELTLIPGLGDLEQEMFYRPYIEQVEHLIHKFRPAAIITDLHPDYLSTQLGERLCEQHESRLIRIQHHQAHIAAAMAEHGLNRHHKPVLGIALDGIGLGEDGLIRGAEALYGNYQGFQRVGYFQPLPMIGGVAAIWEPWRNTLAHLLPMWDEISQTYAQTDIIRFLHQHPIALMQRLSENRVHAPMASSCGRLFDAVAALLGLHRERITMEAEAAIALEKLATTAFNLNITPYPFQIIERGYTEVNWQTLWPAMLHDLQNDTEKAEIAARFHLTLIHALEAWVLQLRRQLDFDTVILSGGVFQNRLLSANLPLRLQQQKLKIIRHQQTPCHDASLALGQIMLATSLI